MTTNTTEPDLVDQVEEFLAHAYPNKARDLMRRLVEEVKTYRQGFKDANGLHRVKDEFWNSAEKELEGIRNCDKCDLCEDHHG